MRKTTFLTMFISSVLLLLVACTAPPTPNEPTKPTGETQATEVQEVTPEAEAPEAEALVETESEASAAPETPVDPPAPEPQPMNATEFEPGRCQVTLTADTMAFRATDETIVAGTLPAGVYGVLRLVQTEAQGDFLGIPLADGREVFVTL
ncbi:MAG: hypothetical protein KDD89_08710, partial [Anaerolineales bacterium]|nr:hypothetical protein [Anaerolineales bacterium]